MPPAAQLVYTNVEQERSPHRRRGVQVWLWTDRLPQPVRDEVEQRVNTFARPGADPFTRRIFAPLAAGPFVMLAQAVPLTKPDKFGRGGRFHTHALLLDRDQFAQTGGDPFAFFDSGFEFQRDPDEVPDEVWKTARLPEVELSPVEPQIVPVQPAFAPVVPELVAWLLGAEPAGTVALPMGVTDTEAVVRGVMRLLPPAAQLRLSFDTLWTGKGKHVPRVCGAGNPAMLQAWTYRQFVRFDLSRKAIQPPLVVQSWAKPLAAWWANTPELTAADRDSAFALAEWLHGTEPLPPVATEKAAEWAGKLPHAAERWAGAKRAAVERAFPERVRALPGLETLAADHFGDWSADGLSRVRNGVPAEETVRWAADAVLAGHPLDEPTARAISDWCGNDPSPAGRQLALAVTRWVPELVPFACTELRTPAAGREWFRDYCLRTLPAELRGPDAVTLVVDTILQPDHLPTDEAELFEAIQTRGDPPDDQLDTLRLVLRVFDRLGGNPDLMLSADPQLATWAAEKLLPLCLRGFEWVAYSVDGAPPDDWSHLFRGASGPLLLLGVRVPVRAGGRAAVLNYFLRKWELNFLAWVSPHLDCKRFPPDARATYDERAWKECGKLYQKRDADALAECLNGADDAVFRRLANEYLFTHAHAKLSFGMLPDGVSFFVGAAASELSRDDHDRTEPLLRALAGGCVPVLRIDADAGAASGRHLNRFGWLVVRLLTGDDTTALGIPER